MANLSHRLHRLQFVDLKAVEVKVLEADVEWTLLRLFFR